MLTYEASISIAAPREAVWRSLADVAGWPNWLPTVTSVRALDTAHLELGAHFVVKQPKLRPATWVVTVLEPPRRFVWTARSPGLRMIADHIVDESASGATVLLRFSFGGLFGGLVGRLFRATTKAYLAREAAALKGKSEALA
jgi:uncharacterized protein YndB with AHSA1/START domain